MEHFELRVLADYLHEETQTKNTWAKPTAKAVDGELERDEVAEVILAEIFSPVTAAGVEEALKKVVPVIDGKSYEDYVSLSGIRATIMAPPKGHVLTSLYSFGTPMSRNPMLSTTLKYKEHITVHCLAGGSDITQDYRVRLWGYVYKAAELAKVFGAMAFPATLVDKARNRTLVISKAAIPVSIATWATLPGGKDQAIPKINPLVRYAYNKKATDGSKGDYQFRYDTDDVEEECEDMYFDFGPTNAVFIEGLGVKAPANLAYTSIQIAGDYHPKNKYPTRELNNPLNFGHGYPMWPVDLPIYFAVPKLEKPLLVWNEKGVVVCNDDANIITANQICAAMTGIRIEMTGA